MEFQPLDRIRRLLGSLPEAGARGWRAAELDPEKGKFSARQRRRAYPGTQITTGNNSPCYFFGGDRGCKLSSVQRTWTYFFVGDLPRVRVIVAKGKTSPSGERCPDSVSTVD